MKNLPIRWCCLVLLVAQSVSTEAAEFERAIDGLETAGRVFTKENNKACVSNETRDSTRAVSFNRPGKASNRHIFKNATIKSLHDERNRNLQVIAACSDGVAVSGRGIRRGRSPERNRMTLRLPEGRLPYRNAVCSLLDVKSAASFGNDEPGGPGERRASLLCITANPTAQCPLVGWSDRAPYPVQR